MTPPLDPIFKRFTPYSGPSKPGSTIWDFLGTSVRHGFVAAQFTTTDPPVVTTGYPPLNEDIIAWVDLLSVISATNDSFTMLELGAGYGLWSIRAAKAFRQISDKPCHLVAVEAEPLHYKWLTQHFEDNGFPPSEHKLINAAVSSEPGTALFYVGSPDGGQFDAPNWYGQRLKRDNEGSGVISNETYEGHPILILENGWKCIQVPVITLNSVLEGMGPIDLVHIDLQGHELDVVCPAIDRLDQQVRHVHIGTHSAEIEERLRSVF